MTFLVDHQVVLFVDDNDELRRANGQSLDLAGIDVDTLSDALQALKKVDRDFTGIIVTDIRMPGIDGLELFRRIQAIDSEIPVILITGHADVPMAVKALRDGAFDFLPKPFSSDHLVGSVRNALEKRRLVIENRRLREGAGEGQDLLIGSSDAMRQLRATIATVAEAGVDVLVEGETGTGKELVAISIHRHSKRRDRPFVAIDCGALHGEFADSELFGHEEGAVHHARFNRQGRIESANRGTLFLDEIDSMSLEGQASMLRVLEEREVMPIGGSRPRAVDIRVIAAVKGGLDAAVERGRFRRDLYYRLNVVRIATIPLRYRRDDIPELFSYFLDEALAQTGRDTFTMTEGIRRRLIDDDWPGNARELRNFALSSVLELSPSMAIEQDDDGLPDRIRRFEGITIRETLEAHEGNIAAVVQELKIPRKTLYDKMTRHGIVPSDFRSTD